jgi:hypothetical protein
MNDTHSKHFDGSGTSLVDISFAGDFLGEYDEASMMAMYEMKASELAEHFLENDQVMARRAAARTRLESLSPSAIHVLLGVFGGRHQPTKKQR